MKITRCYDASWAVMITDFHCENLSNWHGTINKGLKWIGTWFWSILSGTQCRDEVPIGNHNFFLYLLLNLLLDFLSQEWFYVSRDSVGGAHHITPIHITEGACYITPIQVIGEVCLLHPFGLSWQHFCWEYPRSIWFSWEHPYSIWFFWNIPIL